MNCGVAEEEGFEPPEPFRVQRFSRPPVSTTHPFLHLVFYLIPRRHWSGNKPGIQRDARIAGKERRSGARGLSDVSTSFSSSAETIRRPCRSLVPATTSASP